MKTFRLGILCVAFMSALVTGWSQQAGELPVSDEVSRVGTEKIKYLEQKSREYDILVIKNKQLEAELSKIRTRAIPTNAPAGRHRLGDIEWKAQQYTSMCREVAQKDKKIVELEEKVIEFEQQIMSMQDEVSSFRGRMTTMTNLVQTLQENEKKLKATLEQLLLGNYEYYEVQRGDTVKSIAGKPIVYNDASKASWLRQVNRDRVKDVDHLKEGEMLIIPRFFSSDLFAF